MARRLRVLLVAEEAAGVHALRLLAESAHQVVAVLTSDRGAAGDQATVRGVATRLGCRVWSLARLKESDFAETLRQEEVDLLLNVHALHVLPAAVVAAPRVGSFNLHPGPLPQYAGLNAPSWAIYHGERTHAVTVHWMDAGIDTGRVAYEAEMEVRAEDTGFTLSARCVRLGVPLLRNLLEAAAAEPEAVPRLPQREGRRRYYGREVPHDGKVPWNEPAARVVDFIRACDYLPFASPWGHPRATVEGREVAVLKAARTGERCEAAPGQIGWRDADDVLVAAADEWIRVRKVRVGQTTLRAAKVLYPGQRFHLPLLDGGLSRAAG